MKIKANHLAIINLVLNVDTEGKAKNYNISDLTKASDIYKEIMKNTKDDRFIDGEVELTSEHKVFINKLVEERSWSVQDADAVFSLKDMIK